MGWTDIHNFDRNTYCIALALYKIQFEEIWYHKITTVLAFIINEKILLYPQNAISIFRHKKIQQAKFSQHKKLDSKKAAFVTGQINSPFPPPL
jgi:hypothetical protein